jgi:hypothetical protein
MRGKDEKNIDCFVDNGFTLFLDILQGELGRSTI